MRTQNSKKPHRANCDIARHHYAGKRTRYGLQGKEKDRMGQNDQLVTI